MQERLADLARETSVPGAVLGVWADDELTVTPYGVVNTRTGQPTAHDSVFQIGSITKTWTATMVAQLMTEGRLSYESTIAELLPGARIGREDAADRVTVRHLLSHSSGIDGDVFDDTGRGDDCIEKYVGLLTDVDRAFAPGAAYSYCNSGFVILGRMIEVLDGRTWDDSLRERLVRPLGLLDTMTLPEEAILRSVAVGHHAPPREVAPYDAWTLPRSIGPAGLIAMTAGDLLTYARLHLGRGSAPEADRLVDEEALVGMWEEQLPIPEQHQFGAIGLSWRIGAWDGTRVLAHDGGTIGQSAKLRLFPDLDLAVCLLTNSSNGEALSDRLLPEVLREVAGIAVPAPPEPDETLRVTGLERHSGRYSRRGVDFVVEAGDDTMRIIVDTHFGIGGFDEAETVEMHPVDSSGDRFVGRSDPTESWWRVTFASLPDGRAQLFSSGRVAPRND